MVASTQENTICKNSMNDSAKNSSFQNPSDDRLRQLLASAKTIAMVGASSDPGKPSHRIMKKLLDAGYQVIPVNPKEQSVLGQPAVPTLDQIQVPIDIVDVFRRAEFTPDVAREAVQIGAKALWLQLGIANEETAMLAQAGGLTVVMDECIAVVHARLNIAQHS